MLADLLLTGLTDLTEAYQHTSWFIENVFSHRV